MIKLQQPKDTQFYPTPASFMEKIFQDVDWRWVHTILEPSAGKGDMCDFAKTMAEANPFYNTKLDIDCIELDPLLQSILRDKGYPVISDDFLSFHTHKKYDLIMMNPPFASGASHLMRAIELQKSGGNIICILNANTIKCPHTAEQVDMINQLRELHAEITYHEGEFVLSEHPTNVEVAVIKIDIPKKELESTILNSLRKKDYKLDTDKDVTSVVSGDYIENAISHFNLEVEAGLSLIEEYAAMQPYLLSSLTKEHYNTPLIQLRICDKEYSASDAHQINRFVEKLRMKYWEALFSNPQFVNGLTSAQIEEYRNSVQELKHYDFSYYNIKTLQIEMSEKLIHSIEESIIEIFDLLSAKHSWYPESEKNIHYYNGWSTNKAWIINKKVILPLKSFDDIWKNYRYNYHLVNTLSDIEKAFDYMAGITKRQSNLYDLLNNAEKIQQTKNIECRYFTLTFYKKGTCHIVFQNEELLKKLNIFGSQQKKWLPPAYGKKHYHDMTPDEKAVIDSFEGETSYENTLQNAEFFIYSANESLPELTA